MTPLRHDAAYCQACRTAAALLRQHLLSQEHCWWHLPLDQRRELLEAHRDLLADLERRGRGEER